MLSNRKILSGDYHNPLFFNYCFGDGRGEVPAMRYINPDGSVGGIIATCHVDPEEGLPTIEGGGMWIDYEIEVPTDGHPYLNFWDGHGHVKVQRHENRDGTRGGWVALTANVTWQAKIGSHACVGGKAQVIDEAQVLDTARIIGSGTVMGSARVSGHAQVRDHALIQGHARVSGGAVISDYAVIRGHAEVSGQAFVMGEVKMEGRSRASEKAWLTGTCLFTGDHDATPREPIEDIGG